MKSAFKIIGTILLIAIIAPLSFYMGLELWGDWHDDWSGYNASTYIGNGYCNIAVVPIEGEIHTYGAVYDDYGNLLSSTNMHDTVRRLDQAEYEQGIYGVLLLVDSPGGSPAAAEYIGTKIKQSVMPNAAFIVGVGASAGYFVASAADTIIASPFSDVGSLAVTMSFLNYAQQNEAEGIEYISLTSGEFKDYGSPDKPVTEAERALFNRDLSIWHYELVKQIATNRNLPVETVAALADGSSLPSSLALEAQLIDAVGNLETVRAWFASELEMTPEEVIFCNL
jgi:protease IV